MRRQSERSRSTSSLSPPSPSYNRRGSQSSISPRGSPQDTNFSGNIVVMWRFRPLSPNETDFGTNPNIDFLPGQQLIRAGEKNDSLQTYSYDYIFGADATQEIVYEKSAKPIIESVLDGFNGTVMAYGQTSSGKTFTMMGDDMSVDSRRGIIPRMVDTVFEKINEASQHIEFTVKVAYMEIYMEKVRDLLNPIQDNLTVQEVKGRGLNIADLTEEYVCDRKEVYQLMELGSANREVGSTKMNDVSSRSHSIFMLTVSQNNTQDLSSKSGKLYLVDLAGSEKTSKSGVEVKRQMDEMKNINLSLTSLGKVINALTDIKQSHVPYRESKLTRVLQDSLGGNSKTALIITWSLAANNEMETLSTLRFGSRAKAIRNSPKVNKTVTVAELQMQLRNAEETMGNKDLRINILEAELMALGGKQPQDEFQPPQRLSFSTPLELYPINFPDDIGQLQMAEVQMQVEELQELIKDRDNNIAMLQKSSETWEKQYNAEVKKTAEQEKNILSKSEKIAKMTATIQNLQLDISSLEDINLEIEQQLAKKDAEIKLNQNIQIVDSRQHLEDPLQDDVTKLTTTRRRQFRKSKSEIPSIFIFSQDSLEIQPINIPADVSHIRQGSQEKPLFISGEVSNIHVSLEMLFEENKYLEEILASSREEMLQDLSVNISYLDDLQNEYTDFEDKERLEKKHQELTQQLSQTTQKLTTMETKYWKLQKQFKLANKQIEDIAERMEWIDVLEDNLERLTSVYKELVRSNSILKVETQCQQKQLTRRNRIIEDLQSTLEKQGNELGYYKRSWQSTPSTSPQHTRGNTLEEDKQEKSAKKGGNIAKKIVGGRLRLASILS